MKRISRLFLLCVVCFSLFACSDMTSAKPAAEIKIKEFHQQFNAKDYKAIYESASEEFKQASTEESFYEFISAVGRKLGPVISTEENGWKVNTFNFSTSVVVQQKTQFEQGEALETFTFSVQDKVATLIGYNINSRALIVN